MQCFIYLCLYPFSVKINFSLLAYTIQIWYSCLKQCLCWCHYVAKWYSRLKQKSNLSKKKKFPAIIYMQCFAKNWLWSEKTQEIFFTDLYKKNQEKFKFGVETARGHTHFFKTFILYTNNTANIREKQYQLVYIHSAEYSFILI